MNRPGAGKGTRWFLLTFFLCASLITSLAPEFGPHTRTVAGAVVFPTPGVAGSGQTAWKHHPRGAGPGPAPRFEAGTPSATAGEGGWVRQNPAPQNNTLWSVAFPNSQTGWAVGDLGTIIKTADGGATWTKQNSNTDYPLYSVAAVGPQTGWAVGLGGTILKTTNGGATWTAQTSGTDDDLNSVFFVDAQTGWAVGGPWTTGNSTVLKTANGGGTWVGQTTDSTDVLNFVNFLDAQTGWAVGADGRILKTTNGGATWTAQTSGTSAWLESVFFVNSQTGWVVGSLGILSTSDGGATWTDQTPASLPWLTSVFMVDAQTGWAVGAGGTILRTTDGGATWLDQASGSSDNLNSVAFVDGQAGWAVGDRGTMLKYGAATANRSPTAVVDSITPNPAQQGYLVSLVGRGIDPDGDAVQAYNWRCYRDGQMSTQASFTKSDFSLGTHTMYLKVQDSRGAWSEEVGLDLEVNPSVPMSHQVYVPLVSRSHQGGW